MPVAERGALAVVIVLQGRDGTGWFQPQGGWLRPGSETVRLHPELGAAAGVLLDGARHGMDPGRVDLDRLEGAIRQEYAANQADVELPAVLDAATLRSALASGSMRRGAVRLRERSPARVALPAADGESAPLLYSDEPRAPPIAGHLQGNEWVWSVRLADGELRCFWPAGTSVLLRVSRDREGRVLVTRWRR